MTASPTTFVKFEVSSAPNPAGLLKPTDVSTGIAFPLASLIMILSMYKSQASTPFAMPLSVSFVKTKKLYASATNASPSLSRTPFAKFGFFAGRYTDQASLDSVRFSPLYAYKKPEDA